MTKAAAIAATKQRRRIRPPKPPSPFVFALMILALGFARSYWHDHGLIGDFQWWLVGVLVWLFRDWGIQNSATWPISYPAMGKPIWWRVIYCALWPLAVIWELGLIAAMIIDARRK